MFKVIALVLLSSFLAAELEAQTLPSPRQMILDAVKKRKLQISGGITKPQDALNAAYSEATRLNRVSLAVSIHETALNLGLKDKILSTDKRFSDLQFKLDGQMISATVNYSGSVDLPVVGKTDAKASVRAYFAPAIELVEVADEKSEFRIRLAVRELDVQNIAITRNGQSFPIVGGALETSAEAIVDQLLKPAAALLNIVEFHAPTGLVSKVRLKEKVDKNHKLKWEPENLNSSLKIVALVSVADRSRLLIIAQEGGELNPPTSETGITIARLRSAVDQLLKRNNVSWIGEGDLSFFIDISLVQRIVAQAMAKGPICLNATAQDSPSPFQTKLKLPETKSIDCTPNRSCEQKTDCSQNANCEQTHSCLRCVLRVAGKCQIKTDEPGCLAGKAAAKIACEGSKIARKLSCETSKEVKRESCELQKVAEKQVCEGYKGAYDGLRRTGKDYANVSSDNLALSGEARVCLSNVALDSKDLKLKSSLTINLTARARGTVEFLPLNLGHLVCFSKYSKDFDVRATVPPQTIHIDTIVRLVNDSTTGGVAINVANPVRVLFPVEAVVSELAKDDKLTVICPIASTAAKIRVITPDRWWPRTARGIFDRDLPAAAFDADFVRKPIEVNGLQLVGRLKRTDAGIGGSFTASKSKKPSVSVKGGV